MDFEPLKRFWTRLRYAFFHGYNKERIFSILFIFFGIVGFLWTLIECFSWLFQNTKPSLPDQLRDFINDHLKLIGTLILLVSIYMKRKRIKLSQTFTNTDLTLTVEFCDLFNQKGAIVIPVMDTFDMDTTNNLVNPRTVHGQFLSKYYPNNIPALNLEITHTLSSIGVQPISNEPTLKGKKDRYDIGTTCPVQTHNKYFYLSALTFMKDTGNVDIQPHFINQFLSALWNFIPNHGVYYDTVNIPVIGTGINRLPASYTRDFILREIAHSFFLISKQQTFCKTLRICLHINDYKHYDFDDVKVIFSHIDKYLNR
ncbi:macro domain-containing protein [Sediminibacterium sp. C3]|uniref:macro domain-containing protein n=1 Tax=Sediminibacterium sp. C3 TaxID=1267211 RepID=UPI000423CF82|nr:macro domain-containing protein [Sediminibacterium sp. C3]